MNFLNPLFLVALAAVAVPLIIHIFSRRRVPEVPFSALRFLKRSDRRSMRRVNLRRLLLLVLRMAGIALLALAFARPVLRGGLAALFPAESPRTVCVLLDRSYSMRVEEDEGSTFGRAVARAAQITEQLDRSDEVSIVLFDASQETLYRGKRFEREAALASLEGVDPSWHTTDLESAVASGMKTLRESRRRAKELFIISDFQRAGIAGGAPRSDRIDTDRAGAPQEAAAFPVRTFIIPVRPEQAANASIEGVLVPQVMLHRGELADIVVTIRNWSLELWARGSFEVMLDGHRIMEREFELFPGGTRTERVSFPVERAGWIRGVVRKSADRLPADEQRHFALHVAEKEPVLLVADEAGYYLQQALSPEGADGDIRLEVREWRGLTTAHLDEARTVVLGPGRGPLRRDLAVLERFVSTGGAAVVMVLPETEPAVRRLSRYATRIEFEQLETGFVSIARPAQRSPLLSPFDDQDLEGLSRVRLARFAVVRGIPERAVLLGLRDGAPCVWRERLGEGTVVFMCIDPRPEGGGLVLSPYFLPLMQQAVLTTVSRRATAGGHLVGETLMWEGPFGTRPLCVMPGGEEVRPEVITRRGDDPSGHGQVIAIPPADEPGFVAVFEGGNETGLLAVNPDCSEEPALQYLGGVEAADSLGLADYTVLEDARMLVSGISAAREGKEVTTVLLLAAAAILLIELFLAQREREGTEG